MKKGREQTNNNKRYLRNSRFSKLDPEGSCGPTWPEVVPLALSSLWLYSCIKKIINMRLATLLDGAGCFFTCWKVNFSLNLKNGSNKAVKLEKDVKIVRNNQSNLKFVMYTVCGSLSINKLMNWTPEINFIKFLGLTLILGCWKSINKILFIFMNFIEKFN